MAIRLLVAAIATILFTLPGCEGDGVTPSPGAAPCADVAAIEDGVTRSAVAAWGLSFREDGLCLNEIDELPTAVVLRWDDAVRSDFPREILVTRESMGVSFYSAGFFTVEEMERYNDNLNAVTGWF